MPPRISFQVQYRTNPDRTLAVMHTGRIAPYVLSLNGHLDKSIALTTLAEERDNLAKLARMASNSE